MNEISKLLKTRCSEPRLEAPAPDAEALHRLFACALNAPDHALLRPTRFVVIEGEHREELGRIWRDAVARDNPQATQEQLQRAGTLPLRAPMLIAGISSHREHPKVPAIEQSLSTGVALGYLLLALQAEGYGGMWRTGDMAYHPSIHRALGLDENESVVGLLYVGTPSSRRSAPSRPDPAAHFSYWPGEPG